MWETSWTWFFSVWAGANINRPWKKNMGDAARAALLPIQPRLTNNIALFHWYEIALLIILCKPTVRINTLTQFEFEASSIHMLQIITHFQINTSVHWKTCCGFSPASSRNQRWNHTYNEIKTGQFVLVFKPISFFEKDTLNCIWTYK